MSLLTSPNPFDLWQQTVKYAQNRCDVALKQDLEAYLITLLIHYANKPELVKQLFATAFLEALRLEQAQRSLQLRLIGDKCLLFAGLYPQFSAKRLVNISYFVHLGQAAYASISSKTNDLYGSLAMQFVVLMDVLQSINHQATLLPLEAYDQWQELGSQRALNILKSYTQSKR